VASVRGQATKRKPKGAAAAAVGGGGGGDGRPGVGGGGGGGMHAVHGGTEKQYVCCTLTPNTPCMMHPSRNKLRSKWNRKAARIGNQGVTKGGAHDHGKFTSLASGTDGFCDISTDIRYVI
jgi:hypothetical protein